MKDNNKKLFKELDKYEASSTHDHQIPIAWKWAKGYEVCDFNNKVYIDFTSGIFVANSGHSNKSIMSAIINQDLIYSYNYPTEIKLEFLKKLTKMTGFEKAFLLSSGTESVEAACKIMRLFTGRKTIVSFEGAMHGKTGLSTNLKGDYSWAYNEYIKHIPFPADDYYKFEEDFHSHIGGTDDIAGIIIESYRGWDAKFINFRYMSNLLTFAKKHSLLLCFDEIQSGFGRTGELFAYQYYKAKPNLVCCGKGLGGGLPISCVLGSSLLLDYPEDLSSTYSGNPLVCAGALANIEYIEKNHLVNKSYLDGNYMHNMLNGIRNKYSRYIKEINGIGLVAGIVCKSKTVADKISYKALDKGLLVVNTGRESIKLGPPLIIDKKAIEKAMRILEECFGELSNE